MTVWADGSVGRVIAPDGMNMRGGRDCMVVQMNGMEAAAGLR